jgi:hypothetical protein
MTLAILTAQEGNIAALLAPVLPGLLQEYAASPAAHWCALRVDTGLCELWQTHLLHVLEQAAVSPQPERQRLTLVSFLIETMETIILQRYFTQDSPLSESAKQFLAHRLAPDQEVEHYIATAARLVYRLQATYAALKEVIAAHYPSAPESRGLEYYERLFATFAKHGYDLMLAPEGVEAQKQARQLAVVQESVEVIREQILEGAFTAPARIVEEA